MTQNFTKRLAAHDKRETLNILCIKFENESIDRGASQNYITAGVQHIDSLAQELDYAAINLQAVHSYAQARMIASAASDQGSK